MLRSIIHRTTNVSVGLSHSFFRQTIRRHTSWDSLGVNKNLMDNVSHFGITDPTAIQKMVIPSLIKGRSVVFSSETGKIDIDHNTIHKRLSSHSIIS